MVKPKLTYQNVFIAIGILFIVGLIIYLLFKKKDKTFVIDPASGEVSISDAEITKYVEQLIGVISPGFFTSVDYATVYDEVNQHSDYDLIRIANEYNITTEGDLRKDIAAESYWIWSADIKAANRLTARLKELGY